MFKVAPTGRTNVRKARSDIYHRDPNAPPPLAVSARYHWIVADGWLGNTKIVDLSCGAAVTGLGHSARNVKLAMSEQLSNLAYCHSAQFTHPVIEDAGKIIIDALAVSRRDPAGVWYPAYPFEDGGVSFFSGGAEAVEAAVKMAMQFQSQAEPHTEPCTIVGRRHSYHGNSMFTLALGDHPRKERLNAGWNMTAHVERIEAFAPDLLRCNDDERDAHTAVCLHSLEKVLQTQAVHKRRCVVVIETIGGTTIGIAPPTLAYLIGVRKLCTTYEAVLIYDEILCANYRTGCLTAWQYYQKDAASFDLAPDIFVMGKGITAGYFPMSAVVVNKHIRAAGEASGTVWHTSTNQNHVIGCAALGAAMKEYASLRERIVTLGNYMAEVIAPKLMQSEVGIVNVTGVGMLWGVHFAPGHQNLHKHVKNELFGRGYSVYSDGGTIEGKGNMIMVAPPYVMAESQLDEAADAIIHASTSAYDFFS